MRRYTIAKTFALYLGVLSVVARSLPERRSDINVRSPADVGHANERLEELGLVVVSEGVLNGNIHTATYSMSENTPLPKRDDGIDIRSQECTTVCSAAKAEAPVLSDCLALLYEMQFDESKFFVPPGGVLAVGHGNCTIAFDGISSVSTYKYDHKYLRSKGKDLIIDCIINGGANYGFCNFNDNVPSIPLIVVAREWPIPQLGSS